MRDTVTHTRIHSRRHVCAHTPVHERRNPPARSRGGWDGSEGMWYKPQIDSFHMWRDPSGHRSQGAERAVDFAGGVAGAGVGAGQCHVGASPEQNQHHGEGPPSRPCHRHLVRVGHPGTPVGEPHKARCQTALPYCQLVLPALCLTTLSFPRRQHGTSEWHKACAWSNTNFKIFFKLSFATQFNATVEYSLHSWHRYYNLEMSLCFKGGYEFDRPSGVGSRSLLQGDLPNSGIKPRSPALQAGSLPAEPPGKPKKTGVGRLSLLQGIFLIQEANQGLLHCSGFFISWATREALYIQTNTRMGVYIQTYICIKVWKLKGKG